MLSTVAVLYATRKSLMAHSMSVADLKARLADVPGIETLTMQTLAGRQVFGFNGLIAAVDPAADDQEIETAIRSAAQLAAFGRLPPVKMAPPLQPKEATPMSVTGAKYAGTSLRSQLQEVRTLMQNGTAKMAQAIGDMRDAAQAHNDLADSVAEDARALKADIAEFTNGAPTDPVS